MSKGLDLEQGCLISPALAHPSDQSSDQSSEPIAAEPLRLGVMASGNGSNFEAIAQAIQSGQLQAKIAVVVYNNPNASVVQRAKDYGIPTVLLNHRDFAQRESLDQAIVATLQAAQVDWLIMAGWMRIITHVLIDAFPGRILNIHPSLLPSFKGSHAVEQALRSGVKLAGCTVHYVVPEVDSGEILMQAAVPVLPDDTVETLQARIQTQEHRIYPAAIALAARRARLKVAENFGGYLP